MSYTLYWTTKMPGRRRKRIIYKKLVERIGNVIKNNERITVAELASMFDISYSTAFTILDKYFDMSQLAGYQAPLQMFSEYFFLLLLNM